MNLKYNKQKVNAQDKEDHDTPAAAPKSSSAESATVSARGGGGGVWQPTQKQETVETTEPAVPSPSESTKAPDPPKAAEPAATMDTDPTADAAYERALEALQAAQPAANAPLTARDRLDELYDKIMNQEPFRYDAGEDPFYSQAVEQYRRGADLAMRDTMGQAAAMTGGYGNTYAATVGNQAYQAYMEDLNDRLPEYYGTARDAHELERQRLYDEFALTSELADAEDARAREAYDRLVTRITEEGYTPSGTELSATGMTENEAQRYYNEYLKAQDETAQADDGRFRGTTRAEAVAYMQHYGVPAQVTGMLVSEEDWNAAKKAGNTSYEVMYYDSYAAYLADAVADAVEQYGEK